MKFNESQLEQAVIDLMQNEGYSYTAGNTLHKEQSEVLLLNDLQAFLRSQYPELTPNEIQSVVRKLQNLPASALYQSNKQFLQWLADGFTLKRDNAQDKDIHICLYSPEAGENLWRFVNQLEIHGYDEKRIPDGITYLNGLPIVVWEFKSATREEATMHDAYLQLAVRYRRDIPKLYCYNAFCVISDGANTKAGSIFSEYEFFYAWRKITGSNAEPEAQGINALETMVHGLFEQTRLLDVIQNFIYFPDSSTKDEKIVCRYPQYYAARKLYSSIKANQKPKGSGKGGTYFGATGCGKSYTMLFLARLLMRSPHFSSPTIVLITDRTDLDTQLSEQFTRAKEFIGDQNILNIESRDKLKEYLQGNKSGGVYLTTIQKFTEEAQLLSDRTNIICISDEAHRTQTNTDQKNIMDTEKATKTFGFAHYLRESLPNATYVGFTGTPIDATLQVFGEVVDAYTMQEAVQDEITVRIVYEGRAAKVNLNSAKLQEIESYYAKCAEEGASQYQIDESKKATTQLETILGDPQRLKLIAEDFVAHYETRLAEGASVEGKAMFVCASRQIAYNLYKQIVALRPDWEKPALPADLTEEEKEKIMPLERIKIIMTRNPDDEENLYNLAGSKEYRKTLDRQFKIARSNFKIAIVVDMWLTGFDVPCLDTIYIDKPIQKHSLIQTISRVNRVYVGKEKGLVVDYIGIKSNMNLALKQFNNPTNNDDNWQSIEQTVNLVKDLLEILKGLFHKFDATNYYTGKPVERLKCLNRATEYIQSIGNLEKRFMERSKDLRIAYKLCCANEGITEKERDQIHFYMAVRSIIYKQTTGEAPDMAQMNAKVLDMIKEALISEGIEEVFKLGMEDKTSDIFSPEYLAKIQKMELPNIRIKLLQTLLKQAISDFRRVNKIKGVDFSEKLQKLVDFYNEKRDNTIVADDVLEDVADQFARLFEELRQERESFMRMGINFEEKAFYDILKAVAEKYQFDYPHDKLIALSREIKKIVDDKAKYTDWANREDIKAELKVDLILTLAEHGYPPVPKDEVFKEIFEQAENFKKYSEI